MPYSPMEGTGPEIDMETLEPSRLSRQQRTLRDNPKRFEREQATYRLVHELSQGQGGECLTRLVQQAMTRMQQLARTDEKLEVILTTLREVLGPGIETHDEYVRYALLDFFCDVLQINPAMHRTLPPQPQPVLSEDMARAIEDAVLTHAAYRQHHDDPVIREDRNG